MQFSQRRIEPLGLGALATERRPDHRGHRRRHHVRGHRNDPPRAAQHRLAGGWIVAREHHQAVIGADPDLRHALLKTRGLPADIDFDKALFVGTRDLAVSRRENASLRGWRLALFAFLYRNSVKIVDRFNLEPSNVIEIARQIEI